MPIVGQMDHFGGLRLPLGPRLYYFGLQNGHFGPYSGRCWPPRPGAAFSETIFHSRVFDRVGCQRVGSHMGSEDRCPLNRSVATVYPPFLPPIYPNMQHTARAPPPRYPPTPRATLNPIANTWEFFPERISQTLEACRSKGNRQVPLASPSGAVGSGSGQC